MLLLFCLLLYPYWPRSMCTENMVEGNHGNMLGSQNVRATGQHFLRRSISDTQGTFACPFSLGLLFPEEDGVSSYISFLLLLHMCLKKRDEQVIKRRRRGTSEGQQEPPALLWASPDAQKYQPDDRFCWIPWQSLTMGKELPVHNKVIINSSLITIPYHGLYPHYSTMANGVSSFAFFSSCFLRQSAERENDKRREQLLML